MDLVQRMKRALQRGRSVTLPSGELAAQLLFYTYNYKHYDYKQSLFNMNMTAL